MTKDKSLFKPAQRIIEDLDKELFPADPRKIQIGGDHYKNLSVEPWAAMESWLSPQEYIGYLRGNIIKYQARANSGKGDFNEHMNKAHHYSQELQRFLATQPTSLSDL